eukprot:7102735-Alexandrium_andersonii.AAC.1
MRACGWSGWLLGTGAQTFGFLVFGLAHAGQCTMKFQRAVGLSDCKPVRQDCPIMNVSASMCW